MGCNCSRRNVSVVTSSQHTAQSTQNTSQSTPLLVTPPAQSSSSLSSSSSSSSSSSVQVQVTNSVANWHRVLASLSRRTFRRRLWALTGHLLREYKLTPPTITFRTRLWSVVGLIIREYRLAATAQIRHRTALATRWAHLGHSLRALRR